MRVPAAALERTSEYLDRSSYVTQINYQTSLWTSDDKVRGDDVTLVARGPNPQRLTSSVWTVTTDRGTAPGGTVSTELGWILDGAPAPRWMPHPSEILLEKLTATDQIALLDLDTRDAVILHVYDAPAGYDPYQTVIGGQLECDFSKASPLSLTLTLEPTRLTGARPMRFSDFPPADGPSLPARFDNQGADIRISDLELVTTYTKERTA